MGCVISGLRSHFPQKNSPARCGAIRNRGPLGRLPQFLIWAKELGPKSPADFLKAISKAPYLTVFCVHTHSSSLQLWREVRNAQGVRSSSCSQAIPRVQHLTLRPLLQCLQPCMTKRKRDMAHAHSAHRPTGPRTGQAKGACQTGQQTAFTVGIPTASRAHSLWSPCYTLNSSASFMLGTRAARPCRRPGARTPALRLRAMCATPPREYIPRSAYMYIPRSA